MIINFLVYAISSSIINILLLKQLHYQYEIRRTKLEVLLLFSFLTLLISFVNLFKFPLLNLFITLLCYLLMKVALFNVPLFQEIGRDLINCLIVVFLDSISFFISGFLYNDDTVYFRSLTSSLLVLFTSTLLFNTFKFSRIEKIPKIEALLSILITTFNILLIYIFSSNYSTIDKNQKLKIILIIIGLVLINMILYHYLEYVNNNHELKEALMKEETKMIIMNQHYQNMKKQYQENRKLIHDFKNHIYSLSIAYENGKFDIAKRILNQYIEECDSKKVKFLTGLDILDIILNEKSQKAERMGISFDFKIDDIDLSWLKEFDMITIIGNILDNAIEANESENIKDKFIKIQIYKKNLMAIIKVTNSCDNQLIEINRKLQSTKDGHMGIGLTNVKKTVERYDGAFNIEIKEGKCNAIIYLLMHS